MAGVRQLWPALHEGDLASYRALLLEKDKPAPKDKPAKKEKAKPARPSRDAILALRKEARKSEERVTKLTQMKDKLDVKLADPELYEPEKKDEARVWQGKHVQNRRQRRRPVL